jgi:hypothetical protein
MSSNDLARIEQENRLQRQLKKIMSTYVPPGGMRILIFLQLTPRVLYQAACLLVLLVLPGAYW